MTTETEIPVRYAETDQMGIVHHSVYPVWFEAARTDFLKKAGYSYADMEKSGYFLPVVELSCRYKYPAVYGEDVVVRTRIAKATYVRLFFAYEVIRPSDGTLLVTGETVHAWTNRAVKPVNIKKHAPALFELVSGLQ